MSGRTWLWLLAVLVVLGWMGVRSRDPHHTALPFGSTDLSTLSAPLARLPADERALVEAYVARSNGDVLPAAMADPDNPLTARTFGEAIELQRAWLARQRLDDARTAQFRAQREARIEPLRKLVRASVAKTEIIPRNEAQARADPGFYSRPYQVDQSPTFIVRVRIENLGDERILTLTGSLQARDRDEYLPMDLCWIDLGSGRELAPHQTLELDCQGRGGVSQQQQDFVQNPPGRFEVHWEPHHLKLASGRELESGL
jgi:hypothetical protein